MLAGSVVALAAFAVSPRSSLSDMRARKARHYYLQGLKASAENRGPEAYEFLAKAYAIDPSNMDVAYDFGLLRLNLPFDSIYADSEPLRALGMMSDYVKAHPEDAVKAQFYAYNAIVLDTIPEALATYKAVCEALPDDADNLPMLADAYMRSGDAHNALATLSRYELIEGYSPEVTLRKAAYHISEGDTIGAIEEANSLIAANPRLAQYHLLKGQLMSYLNKNDSAYMSYLDAEKLDPADGSTQYALANYFKTVGDSTAYASRIYRALLAESFGLDSKLSILSDYLGTLSRDAASLQRGDTLFRVLGEQYPHEAPLLDFSARWEAYKGNFGEAVESMRYALDLDPSNKDYWSTMLAYLVAADREQEAMEQYSHAVEQAGETPELTLMYASAAQQLDSIAVVKSAFSKLIADLVPEFGLDGRLQSKAPAKNLDYYNIFAVSSYYEGYGDALAEHYKRHPEKKELEDSICDAYENSLFLFPDNALSLNNYAFFLCEHGGDLEKAREMSRKSISYNESSTNLDTYAWILFRMGDYKEARAYQGAAIEKAIEEGTESEELYSHYGDILFMNGEPDLAVEYWEKALELSPNDALLKKKVDHRTFFYN